MAMTRAGPRDVSIVIPSWNGRSLLEEHLPTVLVAGEVYRRATSARVEVVVVDDGSDDDTAAWMGEAHPEVRLIVQPVNEGFAPACNVGCRAARYPIVVLLNNDVAVAPDLLLHLAPHFSDPRVFAVTCKALWPDSQRLASGGKIGRFARGFWRIHDNYDVTTETTRPPYYSIVASGGFSAFDRQKMIALGGFDELLRPFYWEDVELSLRAWRRGWTILYEPRAVVYHRASRTISRFFSPTDVAMVNHRNRLLTHWIHLDHPLWILAHGTMLVLLLLSALVRGDGAFLRAVGQALGCLPEVRQRRRREKKARSLTGRQIVAFFRSVHPRSQPLDAKDCRDTERV